MQIPLEQCKCIIASLNRENARLREQIATLETKNRELSAAYEHLQEQFSEYQLRHPKHVGVKHGKSYVLQPDDSSHAVDPLADTPQHIKRKPGGQPGHRGRCRQKATTITKTVTVDVTCCPNCGNDRLSSIQEKRTRVIEDIPVPVADVIEYTLCRRYCSCCKKIVEEPITTALPKARLGLNVMLVVVWLKIGLRLTEEAIPQILDELCGIRISEGEVSNICSMIAKEFGEYYAQLEEAIRSAPVRYIDETSWREGGDKRWMWAFVTKGVALYRIAKGRGHEVPCEVLGEQPNGVDVHDRFRAYDVVERCTGNRPQQLCWFHILGDSKELVPLCGEEGRALHRGMKELYASANAFDHKGTDEDVQRLLERLHTVLGQKYTTLRCKKFAQSILKRHDQLFVFVTNSDVEGTNNRAERAIRPHVVYRKISGGTRSPEGTKRYAVLASVLQTIKLNEKNFVKEGYEIIQTSHG